MWRSWKDHHTHHLWPTHRANSPNRKVRFYHHQIYPESKTEGHFCYHGYPILQKRSDLIVGAFGNMWSSLWALKSPLKVDHSWKFKGNRATSQCQRPPQGNKALTRPFLEMMVDDPFIRPAIFFWKGGLWGAVLKFPWDMEMDDPNLKILHSSSKWPLVYSGTSTEFGPITKDQWNFLLNWIVEKKLQCSKVGSTSQTDPFFETKTRPFFPPVLQNHL